MDNEREFAEMLSEALFDGMETGAVENDLTVRTFEEEGVLTMNEGLVVRVGGKTFQVTIVEDPR